MVSTLEPLVKIVEPIVAETGLELFDLSVKMYRGTANIEIFVDLPDGGISIDQCAQVNRMVHSSIAEANLYGEDYTLSVSSPGLDWPLKTQRDFRRIVGQHVDVAYSGDQEKVLQHKGILKSVDATHIVLAAPDGEVTVLLEHICKASVMI